MQVAWHAECFGRRCDLVKCAVRQVVERVDSDGPSRRGGPAARRLPQPGASAPAFAGRYEVGPRLEGLESPSGAPGPPGRAPERLTAPPAAVFQAFDRRLGHDVALKILTPRPALDGAWLSRFGQQMEAVTRLDHPGVATVFEYGVADPEGMERLLALPPRGRAPRETPYVAADLVSGTTLEASLRRHQRPTEREALTAGLQIAGALAAAHRLGVVHGALTARSVLLDARRAVRLADLGLARVLDPSRRPAPADPGADVDRLVVLLHELLTGEQPLRRPARGGTARRPLPVSPVAPHRAWPHLAPPTIALLAGALGADPAAHADPAAALRAALEQTLAALPAVAPAPPAAAPRSTPPRSPAGAVAVAVAVAARTAPGLSRASTAGGAASSGPLREPPPRRATSAPAAVWPPSERPGVPPPEIISPVRPAEVVVPSRPTEVVTPTRPVEIVTPTPPTDATSLPPASPAATTRGVAVAAPAVAGPGAMALGPSAMSASTLGWLASLSLAPLSAPPPPAALPLPPRAAGAARVGAPSARTRRGAYRRLSTLLGLAGVSVLGALAVTARPALSPADLRRAPVATSPLGVGPTPPAPAAVPGAPGAVIAPGPAPGAMPPEAPAVPALVLPGAPDALGVPAPAVLEPGANAAPAVVPAEAPAPLPHYPPPAPAGAAGPLAAVGPAAVVVPAAPAAVDAGGPAQAVIGFYSLAGSGQFDGAARLWTPRWPPPSRRASTSPGASARRGASPSSGPRRWRSTPAPVAPPSPSMCWRWWARRRSRGATPAPGTSSAMPAAGCSTSPISASADARPGAGGDAPRADHFRAARDSGAGARPRAGHVGRRCVGSGGARKPRGCEFQMATPNPGRAGASPQERPAPDGDAPRFLIFEFRGGPRRAG